MPPSSSSDINRQTAIETQRANDVLAESRAKWEALAQQMYAGIVNGFQRMTNVEQANHTAETLGTKRLDYLKSVLKKNATRIDGLRSEGKNADGTEKSPPTSVRSRLLSSPALQKYPKDQENLSKVLDALTNVSPEDTGKGFSLISDKQPTANMFVYKKEHGKNPKTNEKRIIYGLNFDVLAQEEQNLRKLAQIANDETFNQDIAVVLSCMDELRKSAPYEYQIHVRSQQAPARPAQQAMGHMGRIGMTVAFSAAAAISGVITIASGKFSASPFLYGFLAYSAVNPGFLKGILSPEDYKIVQEAQPVLADPQFRALCKNPDYNITGPEWAKALNTIATMKPGDQRILTDTVALLNTEPAERKNQLIDSDARMEPIRNFLASMPTETRPALRQMILAGNNTGQSQFTILARTVSTLRSNQVARDFAFGDVVGKRKI
jgi:hypothetical protein